MAKVKYEEYKHIGIIGMLCKTDDEDGQWYIDINGEIYMLDDILTKMNNEIIEIKCDF